jgi:hypothetical protein
VAVQVDGQEILTLAHAAGSLTAEVALPPDTRRDVTFQYTVPLGDDPVQSILYPAAALAEWPGNVSLRVSMSLPSTLPPVAWLQMTPATWTFDALPDSARRGIKWLYENTIPEQPFLLRFVHPRTWQRIQAAEQASDGATDSAALADLGDIYLEMSDAVGGGDDEGLAERFYAQALAAYLEGVESATDSQVLLRLQIGLANLYRNRVVTAGGSPDPRYAGSMQQAARAAVDLMAEDDPRRAELNLWQVEGLSTLLAIARSRRDWQAAFDYLEQMAELPAGQADPERLQEERYFIEIQQALQLLEQGNRAGAIALAGDLIDNADLFPAQGAASLFSSWQVTITVDVNETEVVALAEPAPGRQMEAEEALESLVARWRSQSTSNQADVRLEQEIGPQGAPRFSLHIVQPIGTTGLALAKTLPPEADWALLNGLLLQVSTDVVQDSNFLMQETSISQLLDLRSASERWLMMAQNLRQQAAAYEAQQTGSLRSDRATAQADLEARIRAVNYRAAAQVWDDLANNSGVLVRLEAPAALGSTIRSWLTTPLSPARRFEYQSRNLNSSRLFIVLFLLIICLILISGMLWQLL